VQFLRKDADTTHCCWQIRSICSKLEMAAFLLLLPLPSSQQRTQDQTPRMHICLLPCTQPSAHAYGSFKVLLQLHKPDHQHLTWLLLLLQVRWYERRSAVPAALGACMHDREVVASDLLDTNLVGCLDKRATVVRAGSYEEVGAALVCVRVCWGVRCWHCRCCCC
jgi:hypothetical protein